MEELRSFIDSEDVVTARWLANALSLKVINACSLMEKYKAGSSGKATKAFYLLSGRRKDGSAMMCVVPESMLERRKKALDSLTSCEIYSLQRDTRATALPGLRPHAVLQLYCANSGQEQAMLTGAEPGGEELLSNRSGCVKSSAKSARISIKPAGERAAYSGYAPPRAATTTTPAAAATSSSGGGGKAAAAAAASKEKDEPVRMSKSSTVSAANFFANAGVAAEGGSKPAVQAKKEVSSSSSSSSKGSSSIFGASPNNTAKAQQPPKASIAASTTGADDEDAEWDDGTGVAGHKPNKDNLKKRKVAMGMPEGTGGLHQADLDIEEDARIAAPETTQEGDSASASASASKRVSSMHVHGAIDDWKEEGAFGDGPVKKKTKMKAVEKMLMNDRGYMVTTLVEEEVTDDEDEQQAVRAAAAVVAAGKKQQQQAAAGASASSAASKPKPAPPKKGAAAAAASGGPQKGMMSFFGAKK